MQYFRNDLIYTGLYIRRISQSTLEQILILHNTISKTIGIMIVFMRHPIIYAQ